MRLNKNGTFSSEVLVKKDDIGGDDVSSDNYQKIQDWFESYLFSAELSDVMLSDMLNGYFIDSFVVEKFTSGMLFDVSEGTCNRMSDHYKLPYIRSFALALRRLNEINQLRESICQSKLTIGCRPLDLYFGYTMTDGEERQIEELQAELDYARGHLLDLEAEYNDEASHGQFAIPKKLEKLQGEITEAENLIITLEHRISFTEDPEQRDLVDAWFIPSGCAPLNTSSDSDHLSYRFRSYESYNCGYFREVGTVGIHEDTEDVFEEMADTDHFGQMFTPKIFDTETIEKKLTPYCFYSDKNDITPVPWLPAGLYKIQHTQSQYAWDVKKDKSTVKNGYPQSITSAVIWPGGADLYSIHDPLDMCEGAMFTYTFAPPCSTITYTDRVPGWPRLTPGDVRESDNWCVRATFSDYDALAEAIYENGKYKYLAHFGGPISIGIAGGSSILGLTYRLDPLTIYSTFIDQTILDLRTVVKLNTITTGIKLPQIGSKVRFYVESLAIERGNMTQNFSFGNENVEDCYNIFTARPIEWMGVQANVLSGSDLVKCPDGDPPIFVEGKLYCPRGNLSLGGRPHRVSSTLTGPEFCNGAISYHDIPDEQIPSWELNGVSFEDVQKIVEELKNNDEWLAELRKIFDYRGVSAATAYNYTLSSAYGGNTIRFRDIDNTTITEGDVRDREEIDRVTCLGFDKSTWKYGEDGWWDLPSSSSSSSSSSSGEEEEELAICPPRADQITGKCCVEHFAYKRGRIVSIEDGAFYLENRAIKNVDLDIERISIPLSFSAKRGLRTRFLEAYISLTKWEADIREFVDTVTGESFVSPLEPGNTSWGFIKNFDIFYNACENRKVNELLLASIGESFNAIDKVPLTKRSELSECVHGSAAEKIQAQNTKLTIDARFSQAGKVGLFGDNITSLPIVKVAARGFKYSDFQKIKVNGPYSSMVYDSKGNMYIFYEEEFESESSSSEEGECVAMDLTNEGTLTADYVNNFIVDQAQLDLTKETNISVAISYDRGETWFDFRGLVRLKTGESAAKPFAISDFETNTIHLYFVFDKYYLAVQDIDCTLFDIEDAYVDYEPMDVWDENTLDGYHLDEFTAKGKLMRQGYFTIIDGGPDVTFGDTSTERYWRDPCADNRIIDENYNETANAIKKYVELKDENDRINPIRTSRNPKQLSRSGGNVITGAIRNIKRKLYDISAASRNLSNTKYHLRMRFGRELEFQKIYEKYKQEGGELTADICGEIYKIRSYTRSIFSALKDNKGVNNVWAVNKYTGAGAILNSHNTTTWNVVVDNVCFHARNPYDFTVAALEPDGISDYNYYYTFICDTYNLNSFYNVFSCYGSDIISDEYYANQIGEQPDECKTREELIEKRKTEIAILKQWIETLGTPETESDKELYRDLQERLREKERELAALEEVTTEELDVGVQDPSLFSDASKLKQMQLVYDKLRDQIGFLFIYDEGLYVRKFDNSIIQLISTGGCTNLSSAMNTINLNNSSSNKPIFLSGKQPEDDASLYIVPDNASDIVVSQSVQPTGYFDGKGFLKVFYSDLNYSIWTLTLNSPEFTPYTI
ncbi:MAG: hypothetical protein GF329_11335 [Candidatus Lokiarchaeota archaeon]|nr:hypothetical protein [Candidatus Lokiarchaeota archaeon]